MKRDLYHQPIRVLGLGLLTLAVVGCNATGAMTPEDAMPAGQAKAAKVNVTAADAGTDVTPIADPAKLKGALAMRGGAESARPDPFALTTTERYFETQQEEERIFGEGGGFSVQVTPKPEAQDVIPVQEPQPYRRLSGIVVGDSVLAIFEEQGRTPIIITPGMQIPNSSWRVLSIDQDKAVLVRNGKVQPTQVVVRLETPPPGMGMGGEATGGGLPGAEGVPGMGPGMGGRPGGMGYPGGRGPGMGGDDK